MGYYAFSIFFQGTRGRSSPGSMNYFLAIRHEMGCSVVLYHMGGFFAEVWYSTEDNQIALVHGFRWRELLHPCLKLIYLKELMEQARRKAPPVGETSIKLYPLGLSSGCRGDGAGRWIGTGVRIKPLPAPLVLLLVGWVHNPGGVCPAAGGAVQVGWYFALSANFSGGFCSVHKGVGVLVYRYIYHSTYYLITGCYICRNNII